MQRIQILSNDVQMLFCVFLISLLLYLAIGHAIGLKSLILYSRSIYFSYTAKILSWDETLSHLYATPFSRVTYKELIQFITSKRKSKTKKQLVNSQSQRHKKLSLLNNCFQPIAKHITFDLNLVTDYGQTMGKSLILCSPISNK